MTASTHAAPGGAALARGAIRPRVLLWLATFVACGVEPRPLPDGVPAGAVPHLVLVTVDTWRGDHAFTRVAGRELTPRLDELAARGVAYTAAHSASDCTSPGMAGLFTGLYPRRSGVVRNLHVLQPGVPTLAGTLRRAGFQTGAVCSNPVLAASFGFGRGFDTYEFAGREPPRAKARASAVIGRALTWLDQQPTDQRLFLWVHLMEPHGPYEPSDDVLERFPVDAFDGPREVPLQPAGTTSGRGAVPSYQQIKGYRDPHDGREYLSRYAAEVAELDAALGELVDALEQRGLLEQSLLVVTADHGESLAGEHGFWFSHQNGLWQDQLHVPLVLAWPGCTPGSVVDAPVSTIDLAPTALGLLGVPLGRERELDGQDLRAGPPERVVAESRDELGLRAGRWKLVRTTDGDERFFDLLADPGELQDAAGRAPEVLESLRRELDALAAVESLVIPRERETP